MNSRNRLAILIGLNLISSIGYSSTPTPPAYLNPVFSVEAISQVNSTVNIKISPTKNYKRVQIVAASGVGSITAPCSFDHILKGHVYTCSITLEHKKLEASSTLNIEADPDGSAITEVHHYTVPNPGYVHPPASGAVIKNDIKVMSR